MGQRRLGLVLSAVVLFAVGSANAQQVEPESTSAGANQGGSRTAGERSEIRADKGAGESSGYDGLPAEGAEVGHLEAKLPGVLKNMGGEFWSRSDLGKDSLHNADPTAVSIDRFSLLYKPDDRHIFQLMQEVDVTYGHVATQSSANLNDIYLGYVDTKLAKIGDWNFTASLRLYLPTGEPSHFTTKRMGALAGYLLAENSIGRFDLSNFFFAIQHNQSQNSYLAPSGGVLTPTSNDDSELDNYFEVDYNFNDRVAAYQTVGLENVLEKTMPVIGVQQHRFLFLETGARYKVNKQVSVAVSYANDGAMLNPSSHSGLQVYRDDESWYRLYLDASI